MNTSIDNTQDIIDSHDVIERIEELESEQDEGDELAALRKLAAQGDHTADWQHGETLIRHSRFQKHARELAEDYGMVNDDTSWPLRHIDWKAAAEELKQDYLEVDFDGVTYFIRCTQPE